MANAQGGYDNATVGCLDNNGDYYGDFVIAANTVMLPIFEKLPEYATINPSDPGFVLSTDYDMMYVPIVNGEPAAPGHDLCYWMKQYYHGVDNFRQLYWDGAPSWRVKIESDSSEMVYSAHSLIDG